MHVHFKVHGTGKKNLHGDGIALWYTRDRLVPGEEGHGCGCWPTTAVSGPGKCLLWLLCASAGRLLLTRVLLWRGWESLWGCLAPPTHYHTVLTSQPVYYF